MFSTGDFVVYGIHGVCRVLEPEEKRIDGKLIRYYVIEPLDQPAARYLIPMHNETATAKLRPILTRGELDALLHSDTVKQDAWIADENRRKQVYRELINSGDRAMLICMIGSLHRHREEQAALGRKFHLCDENFLRDAQKLLSSEFSIILGIEPGKVADYVTSAIGL